MSLVSFLSRMTSLLNHDFRLLFKNLDMLITMIQVLSSVNILKKPNMYTPDKSLATLITFGRSLKYGSPDAFLGLNATWRIFHTHICKISLIMNSLMMGIISPLLKSWLQTFTWFPPLEGLTVLWNVWNLAGKHFLMFCKKLNAMQKTYHLHYVGKISIQN